MLQLLLDIDRTDVIATLLNICLNKIIYMNIMQKVRWTSVCTRTGFKQKTSFLLIFSSLDSAFHERVDSTGQVCSDL